MLVRHDLKRDTPYWMDDHRYRDSAVPEMTEFGGCVVTIAGVGAKYRIEECGYNWTDEMFSGLAPDFINEDVDIDYGELSLLLI